MPYKKLLAICNILAIQALFLIAAICIPTFSMSFYEAQYAKYYTPQRIGICEAELMKVTKQLTDYMRRRADDLVITVEVNGVTREFFDDRDKAHMVDVRGLFDLVRIAFFVSLGLMVFTFVILRNDLPLLFRTSLITMVAVLVLFAVIVGIIAYDFDSAFIVFHLIFFNNDLWILDPSVSLLINIVPQEFFVDISIRVGLIFVGLILGYMAVVICLIRFSVSKWKCR